MTLRRFGWIALLVPAAIGIALRLSMIGGPPFTDAGTYQYNAWLAHEVSGSLPTAPINFWSWIAGLVGQPLDTPFVNTRILDAIVAGSAAGAFGWLLLGVVGWRTAGILASAWAIVSATPAFSDAGFKNPIDIAFLPLFLAMGLLIRRGGSNLLAGSLVALACLLREAFAPAALLVPLLAWRLRGRRAGLACMLGGAIGSAVGLLWMLLAGISPLQALEHLAAMSRNANELLKAIGSDPTQVRLDSLWRALDHAWGTLGFAFLGIALLFTRPPRALAAVLVLALQPLPEIFGKFCTPYHWAQLIPAVLLFAAFGHRRLRAIGRLGGRWPAAIPWVIVLALAAIGTSQLRRDLEAGQYLHTIYRPAMLAGKWTEETTRGSRYLQIAYWLRQHAAPTDRLMVSGYGYVIYPLSRVRPASAEVSDLTFSRMTGQPKRHPEWIEALREAPPEFVLETLRWPEPMTVFWPDFESQYELAVEWNNDPQVHYGHFAARLWRLRDR